MEMADPGSWDIRFNLTQVISKAAKIAISLKLQAMVSQYRLNLGYSDRDYINLIYLYC